MDLLCKCHGVSGSCTIRVCWRKLKPFTAVGEKLVKKFDSATQVVEGKGHRLRPTRREVKKPGRKDLIFLEESPDFCYRNETLGISGTKGRECNATSYGMDGCQLLCCGRGYQNIVRQIADRCHCQFVWGQMKVQCKTCMKKVEKTICN